jgi:flagellin-like protein
MKKGISPLVAAVILIAATMSIAGILTFWATGFVKSRLSSVENTTVETSCIAAQFRLYSGTFDNSTTPGTLYLILENQRSIDLTLKNLYLFYPNGNLVEKTLTGTLEGNKLKSFNLTNIDDGFTNGIIKTNCPDTNVEFTISQLTIK